MSEDEKFKRKSRRYQANFQFWKKPIWLWILRVISVIGWAAIITVSLIFIIGFLRENLCYHSSRAWHCLFIGIDRHAGNKYLLSATAQVLGAIFALVFSIALVAGQTVARYTHRAVNIIFDKWILIYQVIFAGAIIWVLWCIQYPTDKLTPLALGIGGLFTLSIPAFIFYLIQRMNLEWIPKRLKEICVEALKYSAEEKAREMIVALNNITTVALRGGNLEALKAAEEALVELLPEVGKYHNDSLRKQPELHQEVFETLRAACFGGIDDPSAPRIIIEKLGVVGAQAIKDWCDAHPDSLDTPKEALDRQPPKTEYYSENIIDVVAKACNKDTHARLLHYCAEAYKKMLQAATEMNNEKIQEQYIDKLHWVYNRFYEKKWTDWYSTSKKDVEKLIAEYPNIKKTLKGKLIELTNKLQTPKKSS